MNIHKNEKQLIELALNGDQSAYKRLYDHHVDTLYCFLSQFSETTSQTEEWTQRAFIKAFNKLEKFKQNSTFKTWLFTIGLNEMRSDMRLKIKFTEVKDYHLDHKEEQPVEEMNIWSEAKEALRNLAPEKRMVCLLHVAENYSHAEIASMIGITEASSRTILHRAKKELQKMVS